MNEQHLLRAQAAARQIQDLSGLEAFDIGLILGSGLGEIEDAVENVVAIAFELIEGLNDSVIPGHGNQFLAGQMGGKNVLLQCGRSHGYEGLNMSSMLLPVSIIGELGIPKLIITNAAGAINRRFSRGDLMLISNHIHTLGKNPYVGAKSMNPAAFFTDLHEPYSIRWNNQAINVGKALNIPLQSGVYCYSPGPAYETPAEIKMMKYMGVDAVGMSTTPEVIYANSLGIEVLGLSCISNMASGITEQQLTHENVLHVTNSINHRFSILIENIVRQSN